MPNVLAMSFEGELAPSFDLRCLHPGRKPPDGWGLGYYPGGEPSASVLKEPAPPQGSIRSGLVRAWEHLASSLFVLHVRTATWGHISNANTQPFRRSFAGRDWLIAHSGSLRHRLELPTDSRFEPVGSTDSELVFCMFLNLLASRGWRSLGDIPPDELRAWFDNVNEHGALSIVLSDGNDLCVYADKQGEGKLHLWRLIPPHASLVFGDADLEVDLTRRGIKSRKGIVLCSNPLERQGGEGTQAPEWRQIPPGHLLMVRQGAILAEAVLPPQFGTSDVPQFFGAGGAGSFSGQNQGQNAGQISNQPLVVRAQNLKLPTRAATRRLEIRHKTIYRYTTPVERSTHTLRLTPMHDHLQSLLQHEVKLSVDGQHREYSDVFGNRCHRAVLETAYTELAIEARSLVELLDVDPLGYGPLRVRSTIPLVWMPWQRHMLQPYLLPPELAESELAELVEYAMSFVKRNGYDLLDTLLDINASIFQEYEYKQGSTILSTTPFEVYANRRGVCQDFTNLFICLARLLEVPARYTCGYIYTGPKNPNQRQSEASHAWVQVYLPEVGWRGFDPTNGILTQTDHVRVSIGRNYMDATPTAGTIFVGGGPETLEVDVRVESFG